MESLTICLGPEAALQVSSSMDVRVDVWWVSLDLGYWGSGRMNEGRDMDERLELLSVSVSGEVVGMGKARYWLRVGSLIWNRKLTSRSLYQTLAGTSELVGPYGMWR